jgi:hypothetical protein
MCAKFLNVLISYFLEVAVQDGIYFCRDFPNHPFTQLLKVSLNVAVSVLWFVPSTYLNTRSRWF